MTLLDPPSRPREDPKGLPNPTEWLTIDEFLDPELDPKAPPDQRPTLTSERDWTVGEGAAAAFDRFSLVDLIPYAWTVRDARELRKLHQAADDYDLGIADADQVGLLMRQVGESGDRPDGMAQVANIGASIFRDLPAWGGEMALGGLAGSAGRIVAGGKMIVPAMAGHGAAASFRKAMQTQALERARDVAERGIVGRLRDAAVRGLEVAATETAVGQMTGGGRFNVEILQRTLRGIGIDENEAGELSLVLEATKPDFFDALPAAIAQTIIEPVSEGMGGALMKLPPLERLGALQAVLVRRALGQGHSVRTLSNRIAELGAWNGIVGQTAEEIAGDVMRTGVGAVTGDKDLQQSLLYEWEELAGMMAGFGAMSAVGMASDAIEIRRAYRKDKEAAEGGIPEWARSTQPDGEGVFGVEANMARGEMPEEGTRIKVQTEEGLQEVEVVGFASVERDQAAVDMGQGPAREGVLWVRPVAAAKPVEAGAERRPAGAQNDPKAGYRRDLPPEPLTEPERNLHAATFAAANDFPEGGIVWPGPEQQAVADFWSERGVDVIYVDAGEAPMYQAANPRQGVVVVSARAPMEGPESLPRLLGHEMVHEIAKVDIAAFDRLEALVRRFGGAEDLATARDAAARDMATAGLSAEAQTEQRMREEALSYRAQDLWNTIAALRFDDKVELLRELADIEGGQGLIQRIRGWIRQMLATFGIRLPDRTEQILRQLGVDRAEVGGTRNPAQARQRTLQAAALAEAMETVLRGRATPSAIEAGLRGGAADAEAATLALAQDLVSGAAQGDAAARALAAQVLQAAAEGLAVVPALPVEQAAEAELAPEVAPVAGQGGETDAGASATATPEGGAETAPKADKGQLIPVRGPSGEVVWTVKPVEPEPAAPEPEAPAEAKTPQEEPEAPTAPEQGTREGLVHLLSQAFLDGEDLSNVAKTRAWQKRMAADYPGFDAALRRLTAKQMEELVEEAVVVAAREIVAKAKTPQQAFSGLVDLYERQPKLGTRTSSSALRQAYSTPAPLAFVASHLGRIGEGARVLEPTAGNGMLLIEVEPGLARVNELDPERAEALRRQGFQVTEEDATSMEVPEGRYDRVIENPPFGKLKTEAGKVRRWTEFGFRTDQVDHAIVLRSLNGLAKDGRAVLIIGGQQVLSRKEKATREERLPLYQTQKVWGFLKTLHRRFNVVDHFQVSGRLYERQGAAWPVDVIVIDGRNPTGDERADLPPPAYLEPPRILTEWSQVGALLDEADSLVAPASPGGTGSSAGPATEGGGRDVGPVSVPAGDAGAEDGPASPGLGGPLGELPAGDLGGGTAGEPAEPVDARGPGLDSTEPGTIDGVADGGPAQPAGGEGAAQPAESADVARPLRADVRAADLNRVAEASFTEGQQVPHTPRSQRDSVGTLLPAQLSRPINEALDQLEHEVGDVDLFVARRLGIPRERLADWSGEQVEAMAQAIHQIDQGKGFIIGDQTGVGKGRFVAGLMQYAMRKGLTPVFVTAKPGLFGDMFRDLYDTGVLDTLRDLYGAEVEDFRPYVTHDRGALRDKDDDGNMVSVVLPPRPGRSEARELDGPKPAEHKKVAAHVAKTGRLPEGYHALFTTYDQLKPVARKERPRHEIVRRLMPGAFLLLDESHVAAGDPSVGTMFADEDTPDVKLEPTLAGYAREMVALAQSVVYSSATWAKTPVAFGLYSKTDLAPVAAMMAKVSPDDIVPLLSLVSRGLGRAGQMTRREKSFDGISMRPVVAEVDMSLAEEMTAGLRAIYDFDLHLNDYRADIVQKLMAEGRRMRDAGIGQQSATATTFSSVMHNVVDQMLFAIKAKAAVEQTRAALARGEKVVLTVSKTFGSLLQDYTSASGIGIGDQFGMSFGLIFQKYLRRILRIGIKNETGVVRYIDLLPQLPPDLRVRYDEVAAQIESLAIDDLPASPIDYMIAEITGAKVKGKRRGARVGEITGRGVAAAYEGPGRYELVERASGTGAKQKAMAAFNEGDLDVLIINRSGSTGFSLHASSKFKDQSPRHMIVVQPEADVNDVMQMLGRINRTGQVVPPIYSLLATPLPAEQRPLANLMRKLASLNANTSAGRKGSMDIEAVDFMNYYGDKVVAEILDENPELRSDLFGTRELSPEGLAMRFTGRLAIQPIEQQKQVLAEVEDRYDAAVALADEEGTNKLRAARRKVNGAPLARVEFQRASGNGVFEGEVYADQYMMEIPRTPLSRERIDKMLAEAAPKAAEFVAAAEQRLEAVQRYHEDAAKAQQRILQQRQAATDPVEKDRLERQIKHGMARAADRIDFMESLRSAQKLVTGRGHFQSMVDDASPLVGRAGIVVEAKLRPTGTNPAVMSSLQLRVLNLDSGRTNWVSAKTVGEAMGSSGYLPYPSPGGRVALTDAQLDRILEERKSLPSERKQWVLTGNLVAAYAETGEAEREGVVLLERPDGEMVEAVLMGPKWEPHGALAARPVAVPPKAVAAWLASDLARVPGALLISPDQTLRIAREGEKARIAVTSKGGRGLYANPAIIAAVGGDGLVRSKGGGLYEATVPVEAAARVAEIAQQLGTPLTAEGVSKDAARDWLDTQTFATARRRQVFTAFHMADESWFEKRRRRLVRSFDRVHKLQKHIAAEGGYVGPDSDTVQGEILMHGRTRARLAELDAKYVQPIRQRMVDAGLTLERVDRYVYARHAPSRNAVIAERQRLAGVEDPNLSGSGMTDAEAAEILAGEHQSEQADDLRMIGRLVDEMMEQSLDRSVEYGLISPKERQRLGEQWLHYVPLRTTMESRARDLSGLGRALGVGNPEYHRAEGRGSLADSPLAHAVLQAQRTVLRGERNRVGLTFLKMLRENAAYVDFREKTVAEPRDEDSGEPAGLVEWALEDVAGALYVKEAGRVTQIQMADALLVRAMRRLGDAAIPDWLRPIQTVMRLYAKLVTQFDPDFLLRNAQRDWLQGLLHLEGEFPGITKTAVSPGSWWKAMRALAAYHKDPGAQPGAADSRWKRLAWELAQEGGLPGYFGMRDLEETIKVLVRDIEKASSEGNAKRAARAIGEFASRESSAVEGAMRLVAYEAMLRYGVQKQKAARFAKELTVNFDQRGELGAGINAAYLFFNASAQGIYRSLAGMARSKRMRRLTYGTLVFGAVNGALQRIIGGDDEETGIPFYDLRGEWEKDTRLIFMIPGTGSAVTIPLPYVYNVFYRAGDHIAAVAMGGETPSQAISRGWSLLLGTLNPWGQEATITQVISPTITDPAFQVGMNQTWSGRPIYPVPYSDRNATPDSELVWDRNRGDLFHRTAQFLSRMTGGDETDGGLIDWSPESIRHIIEFMGGGVGKLAVRGYTETAAAINPDQPVDWGNVPIARVLYASPQGTEKGVQSLFYRLTGEVSEAPLKIKRALERGDDARAAEIEEKYARELDLAGEAEASRKRVRALQSEAQEVTDDAERRELLDMAREEMRAFLAQAYDAGMR